MPRAIVIGGGAIGVASAYYLARSNWEVTLIERGRLGAACSHGNCGLISPSHALPLAGPGVVSKSLRMMARRDSPLRISPWSLERLRWLWRFARRCRRASMLEAARAIHALLESSVALYREWLREEGSDCEWEDRGCLFVFRTRGEWEAYSKTDAILRGFGLGATRLAGDALIDLEPALKPGVAGGWLYEGDSHMRPEKLMARWRRALEAKGVRILEGHRARGFARDGSASAAGDRARAVETDAGSMEADAFVLATGAVASEWSRQIGARLPIQPGKGYSLTTTRPERSPRIPMIFQEDKVAVTPMRSAYRLGSMMELVGADASIPAARIQLLRETARRYLHDPWGDTTIEEWCGWRPMLPDGVPAVGFAPALRNVIVATGHGMLGMSMAPGTGRLVAELLEGETPHIDPAPYSLSRFGG